MNRTTLTDWQNLIPYLDGQPIAITSTELDHLWPLFGNHGPRPRPLDGRIAHPHTLYGCRIVEIPDTEGFR